MRIIQHRPVRIIWFLSLLLLVSCATSVVPPTTAVAPAEFPIAISTVTQAPAPARGLGNVIPKPLSIRPSNSVFTLTPTTQILVDPATDENMAIGEYLAGILRPSTGHPTAVTSSQAPLLQGNILLTTTGANPTLGEEGYDLTITPESIKLSAYSPAGLFHGVQTLRQLFPAQIESTSIQSTAWTLPTGTIRDIPRFAWRGTMLDVARHFFPPDDIKGYLDLLAYYKLNVLHLHLSDDQGWRIQINSWPRLAEYGGSQEVGGTKGGYYTQDEYRELAAYAQSRYITIVPEIDMPGHVNAALASYADLNCDGKAPGLYTGWDVGISSLCMGKDITYQFVGDVVRELAALTPGPYIHIGGDEAANLGAAEYIQFVEQVQAMVQANGKQAIGWEEIAQADLAPSSIIQHWNIDPDRGKLCADAAGQGNKVVLSPADTTYMDMKYSSSTSLGLMWAGMTDVQEAYTWDPAKVVDGVGEDDILGIEAPLWSETLEDMEDVEYMAFPRLLGYAELGWSPSAGRDWTEYKARLADQGSKLEALGINYYKSPDIKWK